MRAALVVGVASIVGVEAGVQLATRVDESCSAAPSASCCSRRRAARLAGRPRDPTLP